MIWNTGIPPPPDLARLPGVSMFPPVSPLHGSRVSSRIFQLGGGGCPASVPLCSHPRYTRWAGGGGELCQYWPDWTSGERQACVTIHGCKIAYVHIQLAFEISVSLKISVGRGWSPHRSWVCVGGVQPPPVSPLDEPPGSHPLYSSAPCSCCWSPPPSARC